jgi:hypothetical protein
MWDRRRAGDFLQTIAQVFDHKNSSIQRIEQAGLCPAFVLTYSVRIEGKQAFRVTYAQGDCYRR